MWILTDMLVVAPPPSDFSYLVITRNIPFFVLVYGFHPSFAGRGPNPTDEFIEK